MSTKIFIVLLVLHLENRIPITRDDTHRRSIARTLSRAKQSSIPRGSIGIAPDRAVNYHCDSEGTRLNYEVMGQAVSAVRCNAPLDEHWKDAIEEDFRKRQKSGRQ